MGPNGSGKSTLAYTLSGHPKYLVTAGTAQFGGTDLLALPADARARLGLFLCFQYPTAIPGVTTVNFMRAALRAQGKEMPAREFIRRLNEEMAALKIDESFRARYINDGFSGGEKKRAEILQMAMLRPRLSILDETELRARRGRAAHRRQRGDAAGRTGHERAGDHPLPAHP